MQVLIVWKLFLKTCSDSLVTILLTLIKSHVVWKLYLDIGSKFGNYTLIQVQVVRKLYSDSGLDTSETKL